MLLTVDGCEGRKSHFSSGVQQLVGCPCVCQQLIELSESLLKRKMCKWKVWASADGIRERRRGEELEGGDDLDTLHRSRTLIKNKIHF